MTNSPMALKASRKKESGEFIELLMFNQVIHYINISQALYILNKNIYLIKQ